MDARLARGLVPLEVFGHEVARGRGRLARGLRDDLCDAAFDRVIPRAARVALADALPAAERITYPTGHFSFDLALPIALRRIDAFLERACAQGERAAHVATVRR